MLVAKENTDVETREERRAAAAEILLRDRLRRFLALFSRSDVEK